MKKRGRKRPGDWSPRLNHALFFVCLTTALLSAGALVIQWRDEWIEPRQGLRVRLFLCVVLSVLAFLYLGRKLSRAHGRRFGFAVVYFLMLSVTTLVSANVLSSFFAVPWPANALHGVSTEIGETAWGRVESRPDAVGVNSWGQRDRERQVRPPAGVTRVAFVGDSVLEESALVPLPLATERTIGNARVEVVNLGVSATDPTEYFFRIKNVALPLAPQHVFLFFYAGNDFVDAVSLRAWLGLAAVYPRDSLLSSLGLLSLNHVLTNQERPVLKIWFGGPGLYRNEKSLEKQFAGAATDQAVEQLLLSLISPQAQPILERALSKAAMGDFYQMLRAPDEGLFRSYYLKAAIERVLGNPIRPVPNPDRIYRWVKGSRDICVAAGVRFTLVIVPEAFAVDARMQQQWSALADMHEVEKPNALAAAQLADMARLDGIEVLDLHEVLRGLSGTYLNMDGHWSRQGVNLVAEYLAKRIQQPPF